MRTCLRRGSIFRGGNGRRFVQVFAQILLLLLPLAPLRLGVWSSRPDKHILNYFTGAASSTAKASFRSRTPSWCSSSCSPAAEGSGKVTGSASSSWRCWASCPAARRGWSPRPSESWLRFSSSSGSPHPPHSPPRSSTRCTDPGPKSTWRGPERRVIEMLNCGATWHNAGLTESSTKCC